MRQCIAHLHACCAMSCLQALPPLPAEPALVRRLHSCLAHSPAACRIVVPLRPSRLASRAAASGSSSSDAGGSAAMPLGGRQGRKQHQEQREQQSPEQQQPWAQQGRHPALEGLNNATKWAVSTVAFGTLLWRRDLLAAWCILGSVVAAVNCRVSINNEHHTLLIVRWGAPCKRCGDGCTASLPHRTGPLLCYLATPGPCPHPSASAGCVPLLAACLQ